MKGLILTALLFFFVGFLSAEKARFDFYRLYEISVKNDEQLNLFHQISEYPDGFIFPSSVPIIVDVQTLLIVPPHKFGEWSELIEKFELDVKLVTDNVQNSIDKETRRLMKRKALDWNRFWTLDEIYGWMDDLAASRPNDVKILKLGTSYEGRDIKVLNINVGNAANKPAIFYEATIHSSEWLGASSVTFIVNELIATNSPLVNEFNWYFLPVLNVDGFVYAWEHNRFWRKTRRPSANSLLCIGADPNRNSDVHWNESSVSTNPCSGNYPGDFAFSEVEIRDFSNFVSEIPNLKIYFSFHTLGQLFMIPPGFTNLRYDDYETQFSIAVAANNAIYNRTGAFYQVGPIPQFFGLVSGISFDWVIENLHPAITFCWELRPNRNDIYDEADIISSALIEPTGNDMYAATTTVITEAKARGIV